MTRNRGFFYAGTSSMRTRRLWKICAPLALACLIAGAAAAQDRNLRLDRYVGKMPDKQFLGLPAVRDPLTRLLRDRTKSFLARFQEVVPIGQVSRDLVVEGCVRNNCVNEQAAFTIGLDTGQAAAASLTQGRYMDIYSANTTNYGRLPPGLRRWISSRTSQDPRFRQLKFRYFK
jgi:hypothetical protein